MEVLDAPRITPQTVAEHGLSAEEYDRILKALGREPNLVELGIFSVMWSEHCSYKSSRVHLKKLPTKAPWVIQGPGENAGVIDIGDGDAAIFKMESHNHPSYIEPYQGAATGVGGILRDVFTMGARPVANANALRFGRFGWKAQQASLLSFAGDAYLNEMGITSKFDGFGGRSSSAADAGTHENPASTAEGVINVTFPSAFDPVQDPEDDGGDVLAFADFMAATRAPGRQNPIPAAATRGDSLFNAVGCNVCHTRTFVTAAPGTLINGGAFTVPTALGNKIIHPFSDFALHNVGTGDGVVQNAGQGSANMMRTAPLWGIRGRNRLMHEGLNITIFDSIQLHAGQATTARNNFNSLTAAQQNDLIAFVLSL